MAQQDGSPAKASGENIEQFGYKQELRRGMGLWDVVLYGVLFMVIIAPQSIFGTIQQNSHGMTPLVYIIGFVAILFTAMSYMRMSKRFPIAGSEMCIRDRGRRARPQAVRYQRRAVPRDHVRRRGSLRAVRVAAHHRVLLVLEVAVAAGRAHRVSVRVRPDGRLSLIHI